MGGPERSYAGRTASERAAERRARLVRAAVVVLARDGETGATMTSICAEAGLTERYFYESFGHRDEALVAALDSVAEQIVAVALTALAEHSDDPAAQVPAAIADVVDLLLDTPEKGRVALVESTGNAALRARRHELLERFARLVGDQAQQIFGAGAWPRARARVHGRFFAAGFVELLTAWLGGDLPMSRDELVQTSIELLYAVQRRG